MELTGSITRGRIPAPFHAEVVRELSPDDILLRRVTTVGSEARPLVKLRYQHHRLAQLLSVGTDEGEASLLTGYSISRISILKSDPAFKQLLSHYVDKNKEVYADLQGRMAGFAVDVLDELQDRLEEAPQGFSNKELIETVKVANDRGGNSPISRSQSVSVLLTPEDIKAIKMEVKGLENARIIEATSSDRGQTTEDRRQLAEILASDPEPSLGKSGELSDPLLKEAEVEGEPGEGENV